MAGTTRTVALTPYLQGLHDAICILREDAKTATSELTVSQWNWTPSPDCWSLAQIVDHLNKTGLTILPHIEAAIEELKRKGLRSDGPFRYSGMERFMIRLLSPNPPFKVPVPPMFVPSAPTGLDSSVLTEFLKLQDFFLACIEKANGYDLAALKITSPANRFLRLRVGAYLESNVTHEQYHWEQVRALLAHPDFPVE
jgi:hypothetical protein